MTTGMKVTRKLKIIGLMQCLCVLGCAGDNPVADDTTGIIRLPDGYEERYYQGMRYGLFVPPAYDSTHAYPLIIRLHGRGDTVSWDLGWYHDPVQSTDPCFVLTPKSIANRTGWGDSWSPMHSLDMQKTLDVLDTLITKFRIDTSRLYIHGASMGGFGVFSVLAKEPGMFAGAFSICGGGYPGRAREIMQTPLWIFHGSEDDVVSVELSRNIYQAILEAGGRKVRYTEYPGVGHNAWEPAWREPALMPWLLAQKKGRETSAPDTVSNLRHEILYGGLVKLAWEAPAGNGDMDQKIWYYKILRDFECRAELDAGETAFLDADVGASSTYVYSVIAVNYYFQMSGGKVITVHVP